MELAISALGSLFGGAGLTTGAAAASTAATTAGTVASAGSGVLSALQGVSTVLGVLGTIGAGAASSRASEQQADQADLQSGQEQLAGTQRENKMRKELARVLGQNDVAYAAAGIDLTQGVAADNAARQKQQAAQDISIDQQQTDFQRSLYKMRAQGLRAQASSQRGGALLTSLGQVAQYGVSLAERG
jgi:hypothetical protein